MTVSINLHWCESIRITHNYPNNGNTISVFIRGRHGAIDLTLYDLPKEATQKLLLAFADENTTIDKRVSPDTPEDADALEEVA